MKCDAGYTSTAMNATVRAIMMMEFSSKRSFARL